MRTRIGRLATVVIVCAVLGGGLYLGRPLWLPLPAAFLVAEDAIDQAEVIFVLSGQSRWRVPTVARLYRTKRAQQIVVTGGRQDDELLWLARRQRVNGA